MEAHHWSYYKQASEPIPVAVTGDAGRFAPEVDLDDVGLCMDDLRHTPFDAHTNLDVYQLEKTTGGRGAASWRVSSDGDTVSALSSYSMGNADVEFALYSPRGGTLEYSIRTSTTGPIDDFAVILTMMLRPQTRSLGICLDSNVGRLRCPGGRLR